MAERRGYRGMQQAIHPPIFLIGGFLAEISIKYSFAFSKTASR
jgi:hypothetical protein